MKDYQTTMTVTQPESKEYGTCADGPGVLTYTSDDEGKVNKPVHGAFILTDSEGTSMGVSFIEGDRYYPLDNVDDVKVDTDKSTLTFSSQGNIYTVRPFQDSDGTWASSLNVAVPTQALEERYMTELEYAFSPNAPTDDENLYAAVDTDTNDIKYLVYSSNAGLFIRNDGDWEKLSDDDESLDSLEVNEVVPGFIKIFDMAQANNEPMTSDDIGKYATDFRSALTAAAAAGDTCPVATQDIKVNLEHRQNAIDTAEYGPLNPKDPNDEFWKAKADRWKVTPDEARKSLCGNCVMFIRTPSMLDCISKGLQAGDSSQENAWDAIDTAELGYCEAFDFKCAASRTCNAWVVGGPITEDKQQTEGM